MWDKLLSPRRFDGHAFFDRVKDEQPPGQLKGYTKTYQEDIERIVYSSAFRRLQNKTQVHAFPRSDYFRNRLTHSLEVAQIGRLIAGGIGHSLRDRNKLPAGTYASDVVDIVYAACLAHDIGNPPFGHSGEEAIQSWFMSNADRELFSGVLDREDRKYDFFNFDGNGQGFRVLCRTQGWRHEGGLRLSAAVMGAFSKYPFSSETGEKIRAAKLHGKKKFGFFKADEPIAHRIFQELGLQHNADGTYNRHPLAYVVEAADDIAYHATDIEDGFRHGLIDYERAEQLMMGASELSHRPKLANIARENREDRISYLRSSVVSSLADDCYRTFLRHEEQILDGTFRDSLLNRGAFAQPVRDIESECEAKLYVNRPKLEIEAGGYHVLNFLMDEFSGMLEEYQKLRGTAGMKKKYQNLYNLFPAEVRSHVDHDKYQISCALLDYISGMTDKFAVDLFRKLSGVGLLIEL